MELFGFTIARTKALPPLRPLSSGRDGWWPLVIREPFTGAWQMNQDIRADTTLGYWAVFACITLIAADIGKLRLRLVQQDEFGIWKEMSNPAYSPVLRKPNRYQTTNKFIEQWISSKLIWGNTYVLKQRDQRGVVTALFVLDPQRVTPLVAPDGSVFYQVRRDDLAHVADREMLAIPAREIIHDTMVCLYHPLMGVSPISACGLAALQGQSIQKSSTKFFANGSQPGGLLIAPGTLTDEQAKRMKDTWMAGFTGDNVGKVALLSDGIKYEPLATNAVDAQLIEQLKWTAETVASCYHVPYVMIESSRGIPYANAEPLVQLYYAQCLQSLIVNCESCLDEGLGILEPVSGTQYGTEFEVTDLIWMDTPTRTKAAADGISGGALSPNEARQRYYGLGPVTGGDSPMVQQQYFSLEALAERDADAPFAKAPPAVPAIQAGIDHERDEAIFEGALLKTLEELHHAA